MKQQNPLSQKVALITGAARRILALAPADQPVIGLDPEDRGVECRQPTEIAAMLPAGFDGYPHPPGLNSLDTHVGSPPPRRGIAGAAAAVT